MTKAQKLKKLFKQKGLIRLVGAHNGLTAKLVEQNGFEAVWASGLEISTSQAVPDANILTMKDFLEAAINMNDAISVPVVADCDTGFGNSNNVIQMVKKYESAGIAAVCIEDKLFPKVNSYIPGRQELASIAEFIGKIMAGKNAQRTEDFMVFARVEALIAGWGQEEALKRARAYSDAGADAILIHSKQDNPNEIIKFVRAWNNYKPLIIVPTSYPSLKENQMKELGIKMVIYANHGLRAAIKNINNIYKEISDHGISNVDHKIASMSEVFSLQEMPKMKEEEKKFLKTEKGDVKVIIPAAGDASSKEGFDLPIAMLDINGKPVLQRTVENLNSIGLQDITVITGYQSNRILDQGITKIDNPNYQQTGIMGSIIIADKCLGDRNLIVYSDILFDKEIIDKLLKSNGDIVLAIDSSYQQNRFIKKDLDLVLAKYAPVREERIMNLRQANEILKIGKDIPREQANYEFAGMAVLSKKGLEILKSEYEKLNQGCGLIDMLQRVIDLGHKVEAVEINGGWTEIKNFEDYKRACRLHSV